MARKEPPKGPCDCSAQEPGICLDGGLLRSVEMTETNMADDMRRTHVYYIYTHACILHTYTDHIFILNVLYKHKSTSQSREFRIRFADIRRSQSAALVIQPTVKFSFRRDFPVADDTTLRPFQVSFPFVSEYVKVIESRTNGRKDGRCS